MKNLNLYYIMSILLLNLFAMVSCDKKDLTLNVVSNDGMQARSEYTNKGYTEVEVNPISKLDCYFQDWDKNIVIPVSGLYEYYDSNENWVASIDFGEGECDEWATKTWNINIFTDFPDGKEVFSLLEKKSKSK